MHLVHKKYRYYLKDQTEYDASNEVGFVASLQIFEFCCI